MFRFDYLSLIKRQAKALAKANDLKLAQAQKYLATEAGFRHYHELQAVAGANPQDPRLLRAALGTTDLKDVIYEDAVYQELDSRLEDEMGGAIAETNAYAFTIEDFEPESATYDPKTGILTILASLLYGGEQDPDRVYAGTRFYLHVAIRLFRAVDRWEFADHDGLVIVSGKSDQELDWEQQAAVGDFA